VKIVRIYNAHDGSYEDALLIDEKHAIYSDPNKKAFAYLFTVRPTAELDTYISAENFNHIPVGNGVRTFAALNKIVKTLKTMSAYELLTEYYNISKGEFIVNKRSRVIGR
jgi:hypothetical protein